MFAVGEADPLQYRQRHARLERVMVAKASALSLELSLGLALLLPR
jgi:hypothetical protein